MRKPGGIGFSLCGAKGLRACTHHMADGTIIPQPPPDARRYRLTMEIDGQRRELAAADPIDQGAVAELIAFIQDRGYR